jgi:phosphopantothenoylcysteine decarboxylase
LGQDGAEVSVVMTQAAGNFIGATTFRALTGRAVAVDMFADEDRPLGAHIEFAEQADLLCVAPATANILAKAASGLADDLLSTLLLSYAGPVLFAPAMNCDMWAKPAVQRNVQALAGDGYHFVGPDEGWLSCRKRGAGRMASPDAIAAAIKKILGDG